MKTMVCLVTLFLSLQSFSQDIELNISNIESDEGKLIIELYQGADDFLKNPLERKIVPIHTNRAQYVFLNINPGEYAIGVIHDLDEDGELDTFLKIPREPIALSNNVKPEFGPPEYEKAKFYLKKDQRVVLSIKF